MSKILLSLFLLNPFYLLSNATTYKNLHDINDAINRINLELERDLIQSLPEQETSAIKNRTQFIVNLFTREFEKNAEIFLTTFQTKIFNKTLQEMMENEELTLQEKRHLCLSLKLNYLEAKKGSFEITNKAVENFEKESLPSLEATIKELDEQIAALELDIAQTEQEIKEFEEHVEQYCNNVQQLDVEIQQLENEIQQLENEIKNTSENSLN